MFGIMRPKNTCSKEPSESYNHHRMHYCGVCKVIGKTYDQKSRMLLNYDTVFMAEPLSQLSKEKLTDWETPLQRSNHCFNLPKNEEVPASLAYAAAASLLLSELKFDDNIKDSHQFRWTILERFYSKGFEKAADQLDKWKVPLDTIYKLIAIQQEKESNHSDKTSINADTNYYADSTAQITAIIFEAGGRFLKIDADLNAFGFEFGKLIYLLDAVEDYEKDIFKQQFNPFAIRWNYAKTLTNDQLESMRFEVLIVQRKLFVTLEKLPIAKETINLYKNRLESNIALKIYKERIVPMSTTEKIKIRWQKAKSYAHSIYCQPTFGWKQLNFYVLAWAVFISPEAAEYVPHEAKSEIFKWSAFITTSLASLGIVNVIRRNRKEAKRKRKKEKKIKRFSKQLSSLFNRKNNCFERCCSSCCDSCFNSCCNNCCDNLRENETPWFWIIFLLALLLLTALIILILYVVGVI